jgi:hypothetical protein
LFPAAHAIKKPRLVLVETFFTYIALSYPFWKAGLKAALASRATMPIMRSALRMLRDLVEILIPLVSAHPD